MGRGRTWTLGADESAAPPTWIFEVDDALLISKCARDRAFRGACSSAGVQVHEAVPRNAHEQDPLDVFPRITRMPLPPALLDRLDAYWQRAFRLDCESGLPTSRGARELILALRKRGVRVVATSSSPARVASPVLSAATRTIAFDDVGIGRPDGLVLVDVARSREPRDNAPSNTLLVATTPAAIRAARRAGLNAIGLLCGGHDERELSDAAGVYEDPAHLLAILELGDGREDWVLTSLP